MADLTTKIRRAKAKLLGTAAADIVVPFQMECQCGTAVTGIRRQTSQQATCTACHQTLFILPVNVYPTTRRVASEVVGGSFGTRLAAATRELIPNTPVDPSTDRPDRSRTSASSSGTKSAASGRSGSAAGPSPGSANRAGAGNTRTASGRSGVRGEASASGTSEKKRISGADSGAHETVSGASGRAAGQAQRPRRDVSTVARQTLTPFRLLMCGVVIAVSLTGLWSWNQRRQDNARHAWRIASDNIAESLAAENLQKLESDLQQAVDAAAILRRTDLEAQAVSNLLLQTRAVNNLCGVDLFGELSATYQPDGTPDPVKVRTAEQLLIAGWHVFQCRILAHDSSERVVSLQLPVEFGSDSLRTTIESSPLRHTMEAFSGNSPVFAARIVSCHPPASAGGEWKVTLDPETLTLMTSVAHCRAAGLPAAEDQEMIDQLKRQDEFVKSTDLESLREQDRAHRRAREQAQ